MNEIYAIEALSWEYHVPYDFYNTEVSSESLQEMLDGSYFAVVNDENKLIGFFCIGKSAQVPAGKQVDAYTKDYIDFGLGMKPDLTGKGNGYKFCSFILDSIQNKYNNKPIRLTVAKFNNRAIHLYEKLGFVKEKEFSTSRSDFMTMVKEHTK
jgi:[ribosomal protein S18]-alanine N-acetyltransferase